jgi:hypothetical protein
MTLDELKKLAAAYLAKAFAGDTSLPYVVRAALVVLQTNLPTL